MEPPVQYSQTTDGVSIAYWTMGEGTPLIAMPSMPWTHLQLEWSIPELRSWYEELGSRRMLVRYDGRGFGLSQREVDSMSLEAQVRDLEAVVDRTRLKEFDLYAGLHSGPVAIAYAARNPESLEHLVLFCSYADGAQFAQSPLTKVTRPIISQAWGFYTELVARLLLGWTEADAAARFARLVRECTSPEMAHRALAATTGYDVTDLLSQVACPTLVLYRRELPIASLDEARTLAAGIPDARLALLEGSSIAPYLGDAAAVIDELNAFLGDVGGSGGPVPGSGSGGALKTILFTDVEGSTTLTERLGDARAREILRDHEQIVREELASHGGEEIKAMGDGFMASFGSAVAAVECGIALQRTLSEYNSNADEPVLIRVGMNAGEPIAEDDDLFGTAVNTAARIGAHAAGGEVFVSDVVHQLVAGKGFRFFDRGEVSLRGFQEPIRLHEVRWTAEDHSAGRM